MPGNRKKTSASVGLDLGLGALVSASEEPTPATTELGTYASPITPLSDIADAAKRNQGATTNPFEELARDSQWSELLDLAEKHLPGGIEAGAQNGDQQAEARIWWSRAQLEIGSLPVSILAAPLETVARQLVAGSADPKLKPLTAQLLVELVNKSGTEQDPLRIVGLLELATRLDPSHLELLGARIATELQAIESNPLRKQDKKCAARQEKLRALQADFFGAAVPLPLASEIRSPDRQEPYRQEIAQPGAAHKIIPVLRPNQAAAAALFISLLLFYLLRAPSREAEPARTVLLPPELKASLRLPELMRVSKMSNLDALLYGLNSSDRDSNVQQSNASAPTISQQNAASPPVSSTSKISQQPENTEPNVRPVVNTAGPLEGPDFASIRSEIIAGRGERINEPSAIPSTKRADELFGVPNPRQELKTSGPSKGYAVEQFESDKTFRVISRTKVMVRPSFHTSSLAELEVGDKVKVESRVGPWLKLRSKRGQSGYILAQDAEVSDSR